MSEGAPNQEQSVAQLKALLVSDFTPPESDAYAKEAAETGNALASFLSVARGVEGIDARMGSSENITLGEAVAGLLAPASVTDSFKRFIAGRVRRAHAWETVVDEVVAPDRLGLTSGTGIFDPTRAKDIEAQALRGRAFDIMHEYTSTPVDEDGDPVTDLPPLLLRPGVWPRDYVQALDELSSWAEDYANTYGEDPGEGLDAGVYLDAARKSTVISEVDPLMSDFLERLRQLRDGTAE
jgi:hypothetical protein